MPSMPAMPGMTTHGPIPIWDTLGAFGMLLWAAVMWAAVAGLAYANRRDVRPWIYRASLAVIGIGVVGQIGHLQEHVAQVGYWVRHPNQTTSWMTPWGTGLARGFERFDTGKPTFGMEFLHLVGNFIFLAGLAGVMVITRNARQTRSRWWGRMGVWMQGIHGLEHLSLTLSVVFGAKRAIGLSTWFGLMPPGAGLVTYRVWWHFVANVIGSFIFAMALYHLWRERDEIRASYESTPEGSGDFDKTPTPVGAAG